MTRARSCRTIVLLALLGATPAFASSDRGTFSIVAFDSVTEELGVAVQSKYFSVGTDVPWAEAGVGAVATQARVDPSFGLKALGLLRTGLTAPEVLRALAANDSVWDSRQLGIADARGGVANWTGSKCLDWAGGETGADFVCQGNILAGPAVVAGMAKAYRETQGEMGERLLAALDAAQAAGGDKRGMQSAALLVVRPSVTHPQFTQRYIDLRVEDHKTPIKELRRLLEIQEGFHGADNHFLYAERYEAAGRKDLAVRERERVAETLRRAMARREKDASMLNGLAWACATHDLYLGEALKAADRAASLEPRNVDILDTLAELHYRNGNATKAIEVESRAATIDPKSQYLKDQIQRFRKGSKG
ncbi:MAG TPA: DUF1028 domain-containing protein [Candidatus Limnocylindrales bacterium]|jgi:uncharacterized Ntn-hydrolase superfamily protein|nr:DUF1028 domain-containing protein [Candidatus Limnocylindrales bacterium]